jgi:hypothetical protein
MNESIAARTGGAGAADRDSTASTTRSLLVWGVVAGPLYFVVGLTQAFTREGFDIGRHALSLLSNGALGWIQIANFTVTGLMALATAAGVRRVLHPGRGGTWGPLLVGVYGVGLLGAAAFRADPADGFPPGTPEGIPDEVSWHGLLHIVSFGVGFLCLIAACFVIGSGLAALGHRRSALYSRASGVVILLAVAASFSAQGTAFALSALYLAVVAAWAWLAVMAASLYRHVSQAA